MIQRIIETQNKVVITDRMWARLLSSTNQPCFLGPNAIVEAKKEEAPETQLLDDDGANSGNGDTGNHKIEARDT